jgi:hypothetical protein
LNSSIFAGPISSSFIEPKNGERCSFNIHRFAYTVLGLLFTSLRNRSRNPSNVGTSFTSPAGLK